VVFAAVSDSAGRSTLSDVPDQLRKELRLAGAKDVRMCALPTDAIHVIRGVETGILWVSPPRPPAWLPCTACAAHHPALLARLLLGAAGRHGMQPAADPRRRLPTRHLLPPQVDKTGESLCRLARDLPVRAVLMINYSGQGMIMEALHGSLASHLSAHAHKPLVLLPAP
jgi:hypothetical protein